MQAVCSVRVCVCDCTQPQTPSVTSSAANVLLLQSMTHVAATLLLSMPEVPAFTCFATITGWQPMRSFLSKDRKRVRVVCKVARLRTAHTPSPGARMV